MGWQRNQGNNTVHSSHKHKISWCDSKQAGERTVQQGTRTILIKFLKGHGSSLDSTNNQHLDGTWESHEKKVNEVRNTCNLKDPFLFEKKIAGDRISRKNVY